MQRMTTAEATIESLIRHGIDTIYALPGVHNDHLFDAIFRCGNRIRVLHTRHEQTAAYMALGAALATGRPQVFCVVPGPGLLNASAALLTAYAQGAPVLALIGQIPQASIDRGYGHLHELPDQLGLMRHMTKYAARIRGPSDAPGLVNEAIRAALSGRQRPVALECAIDIWGRVGAVDFPEILPPVRPEVDLDAVERAAEILGGSRRPALIVGGGALGAATQVRAVAELLEAPVISFRRGRGVLPTSHRLHAPYPVGHRLWKDVDAVLAVGTRMHAQHAWWGTDPELSIVRVDIDPEETHRFRAPACAVVGDSADVLDALLARLPAHNRKRPSREKEFASHRAWFTERMSRLEPQASFLNAIRAALPPDGILVDEVTQMGFASRMGFPVDGPRDHLTPGYQENLGWGYGTALGAKAACPDRAVVAITGDGGFMYQANELATAKRHNIGVVSVVFDDGTFGNVKRIQAEQFGGRLIANDLANPDFVKFARSFGIAASKASDPDQLEDALRRAIRSKAPTLIHVPVGELPSIWDLIALPRVRGFEDSWRSTAP